MPPRRPFRKKPDNEPVPGGPDDALSGQVERVTFHNEETGFCILKVKVQGRKEPVAVLGSLPSVAPGEWVTAQGTWEKDRDHGIQLKAHKLKTQPPTSLEGIEKYLGSGMIKGIGPVYATKLVKKFGEKVFDIIEHQSKRLQEVEGIGRERRQRIKDAWAEQKVVRDIMLFLHSHGLGTNRAVRIYKRYGNEAIELIRADPAAAPRDLLTLLLEADGLSRSEIEDNIITFIGAGHETTARALGWTLYLLSQAPDELAKVEAELDAHDFSTDPAGWGDLLPYTRAAFEESMRLYPPAPSLNRAAVANDRVGNVDIPAGASVLIMPWIVHRHRKLWEHPGDFMPSRFLPPARAAIDRYQFLPFGIGPRVCIGQSFAMQEGVIALAALLRHLRFSFTGPIAPQPVQKITVQPEGGLSMRVERR